MKPAPQALANSVRVWCPEVFNTTGTYVAGGFVRAYYAGEKPSDMDLYCVSYANCDATLLHLQSCGWTRQFETDRAVTFSKDERTVQVIRFIFGRPEDVIKSFDFTVCSAAFLPPLDEGNGDVLLHDDFFEHLAGRILVFQGSAFPLASLKRAFKYVHRGYHLCDENLIRIVSDIDQQVDWTNEASIQEHIAGMDPDGQRRIRAID